MNTLSTSASLIRLFKVKNFNSDTGVYTLGDYVDVDPKSVNYNRGENYYFITDYIEQRGNDLNRVVKASDYKIYKVISASKSEGKAKFKDKECDSIFYTLNVIPEYSVEFDSDIAEIGLYSLVDDYGKTYYFRGNIYNNNLYFAGFYWKIVRINGNGSIRLMYNGKKISANGSEQFIGYSMINDQIEYPFYDGYMYGNFDTENLNGMYDNINNSTIKSQIDNWYKLNIDEKNFNKYIDYSVGFCNDGSIYSGDGISNDKWSHFNARMRLINGNPVFTCQNIAGDLFTTSSSSLGNKALTYPVGLITSDELAYSGLSSKSKNSKTWSYSSSSYWTMSASHFDPQYAIALNVSYASDRLNMVQCNTYSLGIRPVINLKSDVKITGGIGTTNDPFVIENND